MRGLSAAAKQAILALRNKTQLALLDHIKETRPPEDVQTTFGNMLLILPNVSVSRGISKQVFLCIHI